jgi:hypothetical protein
MKTMTTMKTLMLAGLGALSIGIGSAMAQDGGGAVQDYWAARQQAAARLNSQNSAATATRNSTVQYGSSDIEQPIPHQGVDGVAGGF